HLELVKQPPLVDLVLSTTIIRTGQTRDKITVTICNYLNASNKIESYRPEIFGPKITIKVFYIELVLVRMKFVAVPI
ncbi:hypothetical protein RDWZM_010647, partial [Blomia tropicalis]